MTTISTTSKPTEILAWYEKWKVEQIEKGNILLKPSETLLTTWYAEQVVAGNIVAPKKVILACKRHLNDLKRQGTDDFPYIFSEVRGHRPIRFIEKYCKPSKGDYDKLVLQPWQHFAIGSMYGWVHRETGYRRFREGLEFVGRKNGKTTQISGLADYAVCKDDEQGSRVYILANTKQQAGELFDEARAMVQASPALRKRLRENQKGIFHDKSKSKIESRASDSKKLDGLNTHLGIFDEIHEFKDFKLINVIKRSWSARKQPLVLYITTAGYELDGPLVEYYEIGTDVLNGVLQQDRKFYLLYELDHEDEIENPAMWIKANPNIGVSLDLPQLVEDFNSDRNTPAEYADWVTKQFNIFAKTDGQSFITYKTLKKNDKQFDLTKLQHTECIGGFDLSSTEDFTSACLEFPIYETGEVVVLSHSWIPEHKVNEDNEKIPYREYEKMGLLTICETDYIDYQLVFDWFVEQRKLYNISMITYDRANAFKLVKALENEGFNMQVVIQGPLTLSPALKDLKEIFLDGNVIYNNNRLLRWYINNVKIKVDDKKNWMATKQGRYRKIDGFAAMLNAHTEVMKLLSESKRTGNVGFISINDL
ncbi:terminase large subunit [Lysinibacillus pakistanensis]|uniref:Terminase large subunit n=1 Tax=Lysinibacillus pakistanensis TaxID=759811 RepID=A0ABX6DAU1_9BACI|nr:terminase large subunit [Lysinibacillus pakistanensis]